MAPARAQLDRGEAAGPVVAMDHLRRFAQPPQQRNRGATVKSKALKVVGFAVDLTAREVKRRVDQISGHIQRFAFPDANARLFPAPFDFQIVDECFTGQLGVNLIVARKNQKGIDSFGMQGLRQRAGNVGQPAGLGEGNSFR